VAAEQTGAPMGGRTGFGEVPALIVVDLNVGFTDPDSPVGAEVGPVIEANQRLIEAARSVECPIVYLTVGFSEEEKQGIAKVFLEKGPGMHGLLPDSRGVEIDPRLGRREEEPVLRKLFPSGFHGTPLDEILTENGVDTVIVTGLSTSGCVRATVVDGLSHGYRVVVPEQAVGDRDPKAHAQSLFDMDLKYGDVMELDTVVGWLETRGR